MGGSHVAVRFIGDQEIGPTRQRLARPSPPSSPRTLNSLPHFGQVIGRSDELTIDRLAEIKSIVKRDLNRIGIGFTPFSSSTCLDVSNSDQKSEPSRKSRIDRDRTYDDEEEGDNFEQVPVKVVRIKSLGSIRHLSLRGTRQGRIDTVEEEEVRETFDDLLPFALIAPEHGSYLRRFK